MVEESTVKLIWVVLGQTIIMKFNILFASINDTYSFHQNLHHTFKLIFEITKKYILSTY